MLDEESQSSDCHTVCSAGIASLNSGSPGSKGHAKMAQLMSEFPEVAIFRRFGELNAWNLLALQAELTLLEKELQDIILEDENSQDEYRRFYDKDFFLLSHPQIKCGGSDRQWAVLLRIRGLLRDYDETLQRQCALAKLPEPKWRDLKFLKEWMARSDLGNIYLKGCDHDLWETTPLFELVAIDPKLCDDGLTFWLTETVIYCWYRLVGQRNNKAKENMLANTTTYSRRTVKRVVSVITIGLASMFPIVSIIILSYSRPTARLAILGAFTVAFASCLAWVTGGDRKIDIFAASAAFAAVQVVFISTGTKD